MSMMGPSLIMYRKRKWSDREEGFQSTMSLARFLRTSIKESNFRTCHRFAEGECWLCRDGFLQYCENFFQCFAETKNCSLGG